ncbi:hypothetical protein Desde_1068 [Desulfitobacterium dehalogenans ATCC 51507]|uniref:Uncharacterized protein n=1 Tax=Desulfitobacterium dehalogenans (strain ATCC 51507 / DSM 9161 / JW/IU-DC1) TaxID=756499 RepID=I4A6B6_DESDJ|nr:hypothetical protein [Desulfitobacterium dehalogenans]AFL99500.1 hypothetical protein Desde_1068 [Desulfitobacterium dehalogenans ATCC 51507]
MIKLNVVPKENEDWTETRAKVYFLQQIAEKMELLTEEVKKNNQQQNHISQALERERESGMVLNCALMLMVNKAEIIERFGEQEDVPFSSFYREMALSRQAVIDWVNRNTLVKAICKTDYLYVYPVGTGHRVKVINKREEIAL